MDHGRGSSGHPPGHRLRPRHQFHVVRRGGAPLPLRGPRAQGHRWKLARCPQRHAQLRRRACVVAPLHLPEHGDGQTQRYPASTLRRERHRAHVPGPHQEVVQRRVLLGHQRLRRRHRGDGLVERQLHGVDRRVPLPGDPEVSGRPGQCAALLEGRRREGVLLQHRAQLADGRADLPPRFRPLRLELAVREGALLRSTGDHPVHQLRRRPEPALRLGHAVPERQPPAVPERRSGGDDAAHGQPFPQDHHALQGARQQGQVLQQHDVVRERPVQQEHRRSGGAARLGFLGEPGRREQHQGEREQLVQPRRLLVESEPDLRGLERAGRAGGSGGFPG